MRFKFKIYTSINSELLLEVAEEVTKIDMEEVTFLGNHNIIGVTITNTEDVRRHAIPSTTQLEILNMLLQVLLVLTVRLQEHHNRFTDQATESLIVHLMNSSCRLTIPYDLKHSHLVLRRNHIIRLHTINKHKDYHESKYLEREHCDSNKKEKKEAAIPQIETVIEPNLIHNSNELESQDILTEIITVFEHDHKLRLIFLVQHNKPQRLLLRVHELYYFSRYNIQSLITLQQPTTHTENTEKKHECRLPCTFRNRNC